MIDLDCRPWNFTAPWSEMIVNQAKMTETYLPQLEALTPGGGAYLNEVYPILSLNHPEGLAKKLF